MGSLLHRGPRSDTRGLRAGGGLPAAETEQSAELDNRGLVMMQRDLMRGEREREWAPLSTLRGGNPRERGCVRLGWSPPHAVDGLSSSPPERERARERERERESASVLLSPRCGEGTVERGAFALVGALFTQWTH
jgi:hypothetical protein